MPPSDYIPTDRQGKPVQVDIPTDKQGRPFHQTDALIEKQETLVEASDIEIKTKVEEPSEGEPTLGVGDSEEGKPIENPEPPISELTTHMLGEEDHWSTKPPPTGFQPPHRGKPGIRPPVVVDHRVTTMALGEEDTPFKGLPPAYERPTDGLRRIRPIFNPRIGNIDFEDFGFFDAFIFGKPGRAHRKQV